MNRPVISALLIAIALLLGLLPACEIAPSTPVAVGSSQTLNLWDSGPITVDPAISGDLSSHTYVTQIFSGLVYLDEDMNVKPDIAESWQKSADGKTYTFHLRKNVKFHDSRQLTAADVKYSWERACNPGTNSTTAPMYLNDIAGAADVIAGKAEKLSGVKIIDDYSLEVSIDAPKAYFLSKMAYPTAFIVDKANLASPEAKEWWMKPNGTGPFKLQKWTPGKEIVLQKNTDFYREKPNIDIIDFQILTGLPNDLYELNKIDVADVNYAYIDISRDARGPFPNQLAVFPELSFNYIGFNVNKPPFDDLKVRQAFCCSVDRDKIIKVILKDTVHKATGILPPGMPGHNAGLTGYEHNIEKARQLIAESRYKDASAIPPVTITISGIGNNVPEPLGAMIVGWQDNLGIKVTVRQLESQNFLYGLKNEADEMFMLGWVADYPDPQNFTDNLFKTGFSFNIGNYSNKRIDASMEAAAVEQDSAKRMAMYSQIEQSLLDDAPVIPLWNGINYVLVKPYVKGYKMNAMGLPSLSNVSLSK
jgi:oligopeptide transport system substrate-binding protein